MARPDIPKPPVDPREVTAVDIRYVAYFFCFALCLYIIASFGLIAEV